jgi:nucleoside-diphosphate-sugar epimerase
MRILVTGSSGFVGKALLPQLSLAGHEVFEFSGDIRNKQDVMDSIACDPHIVIHLAARTEVEQSFYEQTLFTDINYTGTVNLVELVREHCVNLENFVFASTMEVYGWQPISDKIRDNTLRPGEKEKICNGEITFDELTTPMPNAPYAVAKLACENYLHYMGRSHDFPYTILRQTNTYGRTDNDFFVTEAIITRMLANPERVHLGYHEPYRNFLYIDDLIDAWVTVVENTQVCRGHTFCLGPAQAITIKDYALKIGEKMDWHGSYVWNTQPKRPGEIYLLSSTPEKLTRLTGWKPQVTLDQGLDRTIAFWTQAHTK